MADPANNNREVRNRSGSNLSIDSDESYVEPLLAELNFEFEQDVVDGGSSMNIFNQLEDAQKSRKSIVDNIRVAIPKTRRQSYAVWNDNTSVKNESISAIFPNHSSYIPKLSQPNTGAPTKHSILHYSDSLVHDGTKQSKRRTRILEVAEVQVFDEEKATLMEVVSLDDTNNVKLNEEPPPGNRDLTLHPVEDIDRPPPPPPSFLQFSRDTIPCCNYASYEEQRKYSVSFKTEDHLSTSFLVTNTPFQIPDDSVHEFHDVFVLQTENKETLGYSDDDVFVEQLESTNNHSFRLPEEDVGVQHLENSKIGSFQFTEDVVSVEHQLENSNNDSFRFSEDDVLLENVNNGSFRVEENDEFVEQLENRSFRLPEEDVFVEDSVRYSEDAVSVERLEISNNRFLGLSEDVVSVERLESSNNLLLGLSEDGVIVQQLEHSNNLLLKLSEEGVVVQQLENSSNLLLKLSEDGVVVQQLDNSNNVSFVELSEDDVIVEELAANTNNASFRLSKDDDVFFESEADPNVHDDVSQNSPNAKTSNISQSHVVNKRYYSKIHVFASSSASGSSLSSSDGAKPNMEALEENFNPQAESSRIDLEDEVKTQRVQVDLNASVVESKNLNYLSHLPLVPTEPGEYVPILYTFRVKSKDNKTFNKLTTQLPPFYVLLDHTIAVIWTLFNAGADKESLGIAQLQWALYFLQSIHNVDGVAPKDVQLVIETIQDYLIDEYSDISEESVIYGKGKLTEYFKPPEKVLPFSVNYTQMMEKSAEIEKEEAAPVSDNLQEEIENLKKITGIESIDLSSSLSKDKTINVLCDWKREQMEKIQDNLTILHTVENMLKEMDETFANEEENVITTIIKNTCYKDEFEAMNASKSSE